MPGANYGAGEPRLLFYPPLSWLLGAALGTLLPWTAVPAVFTALCLAGAAAAMFALAQAYCGWASASLAAVFYAASPYLLFTALERTAYGELLAAVWMPLLLRTLLRPRFSIVWAAAWLAALWYTNAPAGVMGCYLVALFAGWRAGSAVLRRRWQEARHAVVQGAAALLFGGALAADYLLPAWYEQRWVQIGRAVGQGMRIQDSLLFEHTGAAFHDQVLRTASWIAVLTLGAGIAAGIVANGRLCAEASAGVLRRKTPVLLLVLLVLISLLQLRLSLPLWHFLPELAFLQFPWRLLLPASAAAALLVVLCLRSQTMPARLALLGAGIFWLVGMMFWAGHTLYQPCDDQDCIPAQIPLAANGGFEGTDEYTPRGTDNGEIQQGLPLVRLLHAPDADEGDDTQEPNPDWHPETSARVAGLVAVLKRGSESMAVRVLPTENAWAILRQERWPGARILRDGTPCVAACPWRRDGLIAVHTPAHQVTTIVVQAYGTADLLAGRVISLLALLTLFAPPAWGMRHRFAPRPRL